MKGLGLVGGRAWVWEQGKGGESSDVLGTVKGAHGKKEVVIGPKAAESWIKRARFRIRQTWVHILVPSHFVGWQQASHVTSSSFGT